MYPNREEFIKALGVEEMPALFGARYDKVMAEYEEKGVPYLEDAFVEGLQRTYGIFREAEKDEFVK